MEESTAAGIKQEGTGGGAAAGGTTAVAAISELIRFPFEDPDWRKKFLIGSLMIFLNFIIPILPMLAMGGYALKVMGQAVRGESPSLPEWDDWGDLIVEGLKGGGLVLIYLLPGYLLLFGGYFFFIFSQVLAVPLSAIASSSSDPGAVVGTLGLTLGSFLLQFIVMGLGFILVFAGLLPLPLALGNYLHEGEFRAGLNLRQIWAYFKVNKSGFLAAWIIYIGLAYLISVPTLILYFTIVLICLLPILIAPGFFFVYVTGAVGFGQYYRETRKIYEGKGFSN